MTAQSDAPALALRLEPSFSVRIPRPRETRRAALNRSAAFSRTPHPDAVPAKADLPFSPASLDFSSTPLKLSSAPLFSNRRPSMPLL